MTEENVNKVLELISLEHKKRALEEELKKIVEEEDKIKESVLNDMIESKEKVYEDEEIRITYIAPIVRETIDTSKLKKMYPDIANECKKTNEVKQNWKITLKGDND